MSTYQIACKEIVGILSYISDLVAHPVCMFQNGFVATTATPPLPTTVINNTPTYETPLVWSRDFLEQSGFNLSERIPAIIGVYEVPGARYFDNFATKKLGSAVPPQLIHELSLHWRVKLVSDILELVMDTVRCLGLVGLAWYVLILLFFVALYHWPILPLISQIWEELEQDVAMFMQRQFPCTAQLPPTSRELPPGSIIMSAEEIKALNASADAIQRRIDHLQDQLQSDAAHNKRRIAGLETQLGFEKTNCEEAQAMARDLRSNLQELSDKLRETRDLYNDLQISYGKLADGNEEKEEEIVSLKAAYDHLQVSSTQSNQGHVEPSAEGAVAAETAAVEEEGEHQDNHDEKDDSGNGERDGDDDNDDDERKVGEDTVTTDAIRARDDHDLTRLGDVHDDNVDRQVTQFRDLTPYRESEADEGPGHDEERSDGEDHKGEDDGEPVLGRFKATRDPSKNKDEDDVPMLGKYKVTRGPALNEDVEDGKEDEVKEDGEKGEKGEKQEDREKGPKKEGRENEEKDAEKRDEKHESENPKTPKADENSNAPLPQSHPLSQKLHAYMGEPTSVSLPSELAALSDKLSPKNAHNGPLARLLPSNFFTDSEIAIKKHNEEVADAFADYVNTNGTGSLSESMWAPKQSADRRVTRAPPRGPANFNLLPKPQPPPGAPTGPRDHQFRVERSHNRSDSSMELGNPDTTPRVRLPTPPPRGFDEASGIRGASQVEWAPVIPATSQSVHGEQNDGPSSQDLRIDTRDAPIGGSGSQSPLGHGSGHVWQGAQGPRIPPVNTSRGPIANVPQGAPTRPQSEDDFSILGASGRRSHQAQAPSQTPPPNEARAETRSPGFPGRGHGRGRNGRGGYGSSQTSTPKPSVARGLKASNAADDSFRRWKENMKRDVEEAKKRQG